MGNHLLSRFFWLVKCPKSSTKQILNANGKIQTLWAWQRSNSIVYQHKNRSFKSNQVKLLEMIWNAGNKVRKRTVGLPGCIQGLRRELWKKTRKVEKSKSRKVAAKLEKSKSPKSRKVAAKVEKSEKSKSGSKSRKVKKPQIFKFQGTSSKIKVCFVECSWFMISPHPSLNFHSEGVRAIL